jgi:hypothetical protein
MMPIISGILLLDESSVFDWAFDGVDVPSGAAVWPAVGGGVGAGVCCSEGGGVGDGLGAVVGLTVVFFVVGAGVSSLEESLLELGASVVGFGVLVGLAVVGSGVGSGVGVGVGVGVGAGSDPLPELSAAERKRIDCQHHFLTNQATNAPKATYADSRSCRPGTCRCRRACSTST